MNHSNQNQVNVTGAAVAVAATNNADQRENPPPYLKLIADCWEHVFDYLSLNDIIVIGETCKRMQQMAGYYVREYFPKHYFYLTKGKVRYSNGFFTGDMYHLRADFYQYITSLCIKDELNDFLEADTFSSLKTITFRRIELSATNIQYIRNVLKNVENLKVFCKIKDTESIEQLVAYCPKLKYLNISDLILSDFIIKPLFTLCFPTLERLKFGGDSDARIDELKTFLEKHSELKHFECDYSFLWANRDSLIDTNNVRLNTLAIALDFEMNIQFDQFVDFLKTLHARGFYKTLHLLFEGETGETENFDEMATAINTLPKLEKLRVMSGAMIDLSRLNNLKELYLNVILGVIEGSITQVEVIAKRLIKLERLTLIAEKCADIQPFIRYSKALKSIEFYLILSTDYFDLIALNEERKQLDGASRVTIYADEKTYLLTKWKSQNVNLSHIELRRVKSYSH